MAENKKLTSGQKHLLKLIAQDEGPEGWTEVSRVVAPLFTNTKIPGGVIPKELCEFEHSDADGRGRVRLTAEGRNVLNAMSWL